jgi:hypothetical protein
MDLRINMRNWQFHHHIHKESVENAAMFPGCGARSGICMTAARNARQALPR